MRHFRIGASDTRREGPSGQNGPVAIRLLAPARENRSPDRRITRVMVLMSHHRQEESKDLRGQIRMHRLPVDPLTIAAQRHAVRRKVRCAGI